MKKYLPIVVVLAIAAAAAAYFMLRRGKTTIPSGTVTVTTETGTAETQTFTGTLKEAISRGIGMRCTYVVEGNEYEGYVKGENYRGKIITAEGDTGWVIVKDNCMWTWTEDERRGIKTCYEEIDTETEEGPGEVDVWEQPQGAVSPNINYSCTPATVSDSQFVPPTDVDFFDIGTMMQEIEY